MKNLKVYLTLLVSLCFFVSLNAQVMLGVRGGTTFSTFYNGDDFFNDEDVDKPYLIGYDAGIFANIHISEMFSVQPEVHIMNKGLLLREESPTEKGEYAKWILRYNYLEVPLLAKGNFGTEVIGFNIFVGPSFGYALNGKEIRKNMDVLGYEDPFDDYEKDIEWDDEWGADGTKDNRFDLSGVAGFGVNYNFGNNSILFDARYAHDFLDAIRYEEKPDPNPYKFFNTGFVVTLGYGYTFF